MPVANEYSLARTSAAVRAAQKHHNNMRALLEAAREGLTNAEIKLREAERAHSIAQGLAFLLQHPEHVARVREVVTRDSRIDTATSQDAVIYKDTKGSCLVVYRWGRRGCDDESWPGLGAASALALYDQLQNNR